MGEGESGSPLEGLQAWLAAECERHNLTWREASINAGINAGAISAIMTGIRPGLQVCISLGEYFDVGPEYVLRLAGHLPPKEERVGLTDLAAQKFDRALELFSVLPEHLQEEFAGLMLELGHVLKELYQLSGRIDPPVAVVSGGDGGGDE